MRFFLVLVLIAALFLVWREFNPSDSHYFNFFKRISGFDLPEKSKILSKDHTTYSLTEFGQCFIAQVPESELDIFQDNSNQTSEPIERSCGKSIKYSFNRKGENISDYPFTAWYLSKGGIVWAYYERY